MTAKPPIRTPSFRHHKASRQGYVELDGRRIYLGRSDLPPTREKYHRLIAEWIANGRQLPVGPDEITVGELILRFWGQYTLVGKAVAHNVRGCKSILRRTARGGGNMSGR